jgi:acyl-CoA thioesterase-1
MTEAEGRLGAPGAAPLECSVDPLRSFSFRRALALLFAALACALPSVPALAQSAPVVLVLGDSISAAYGLPSGAGWVALLQERLAADHLPHRVVNASISGDTTAGGRERLPALLKQHHPAITVIELGGNDGLRGGSLDAMRDNLDAMIVEAKKAASRVLVIGIRLPPNYGPAYTQRFAAIFADVAKAHKAAVVPFFFEGFGEDNAMFQGDRIHPTAAAQAKLLDNVWPELKPLLAATSKAK